MALLMARMDVVRQQSISFSSKQDADTGVAARHPLMEAD